MRVLIWVWVGQTYYANFKDLIGLRKCKRKHVGDEIMYIVFILTNQNDKFEQQKKKSAGSESLFIRI